jgi:acyl carrier protein
MSTATDLVADDRVVGIVHEILERRSISRPVLVDEDLREVGLNSLDLVNLMLSVEAEFDLKIPESEMTLRNFRSITAIRMLIASLQQHERTNYVVADFAHAQGAKARHRSRRCDERHWFPANDLNSSDGIIEN